MIVLPALFFYIGVQLTGQLRKSNFLLGTGFLIYYGGRVIQPFSGFLDSIYPSLAGILAPILVFIALMLIALGVLLEERE